MPSEATHANAESLTTDACYGNPVNQKVASSNPVWGAKFIPYELSPPSG